MFSITVNSTSDPHSSGETFSSALVLFVSCSASDRESVNYLQKHPSINDFPLFTAFITIAVTQATIITCKWNHRKINTFSSFCYHQGPKFASTLWNTIFLRLKKILSMAAYIECIMLLVCGGRGETLIWAP